ncbi:MAG TPA: DUF4344 domain-containing metallopeptidase [Gammaproteobacteria bacterium]|nr:DUF4344 domain-containing metallopeptidase [Gammaproteobacteria bacterium]
MRARRILRALAVVALVGTAISPAACSRLGTRDSRASSRSEAAAGSAAGDEPRDERDERAERDVVAFVDGNIEFLLLHEIAHLLITEKRFPIVGPTENAADYIATWALLNEEPFDPTQRDRPLRFLLSAASAFAAAWRGALDAGAQLPYWGDHALSIQRYYQIACLVYGSDPQGFTRIPEIAGLPASRASDCVAEYRRTDDAIRWLISTYGRKPGDPAPAPTKVVFEAPRTLVSARISESLESLQLLERTAERLNQRFALDEPFSLIVRSCGRPEAAWMPDSREIVICYELMDYIYTLGLGERPGRLDPALPAR